MSGRGAATIVHDPDAGRTDLDRYGYCLVADALDPTSVLEIRALLLARAQQERAEGTDYVYADGSNQRIWSLLNKGAIFSALAEHPVALELERHLLGEHLLLSNLSANIAGPGGRPMAQHWDQDFVPRPWPYPMMSHIIWMIDDFTEDNGPTVVAPGSHLLDGRPPEGATIAATGPAGTALCVDARTWHGTAPNRARTQRIGVLAYYCRMFVRPQEAFLRSLDPSVLERASPTLRSLLGEVQHDYIGMFDGPPREWPRY